MSICIDDIFGTSPSSLAGGAWLGELRSAGIKDRLTTEALNLIEESRFARNLPQTQTGTAEPPQYYSLETAGVSHELLAEIAKAYAALCQNSIRGAVTYDQRQRFRECLDAFLEHGIPNDRRIVSRLQSLLEMSSEDEPENPAPINVDSLDSMVEFLARARIQRYPDISLSPDGLVFLEWYDSPEQTLSLLFLPDGSARLLWTRRIKEAIPRRDRVSATMGIAPLVSFLKHNNALPPGS
jgi:hypothetical protein